MTISILRNRLEGSSLATPTTAYLDWCRERLLNYQVPGALIGIVAEQGLEVLASFGVACIDTKTPISPEHRFRIASISKLFTSIAIMQLHEQGKLNIREPLERFLPWFRSSSSNLDPITPWHLLTHSSGLTRESGMQYWNDQKFPSVEELQQYVSGLQAVYAPEFLWKYSNLGMALLGHTVSAVSGIPYEEYIHRYILSPLYMSDTVVNDLGASHPLLATGYSRFLSPNSTREIAPYSDVKALAPAAGMTSTVEDLAKFTCFNFAPEKHDIIRDETLREMHRVHWLDSSWEFGIGLGFLSGRVDGHTIIGHNGWIRGYRTSIKFCREKKLGVIILLNCDLLTVEEFTNKCFELLLPCIVSNRTDTYPHQLSPLELSKAVGVYANHFGACRLLEHEGALVILDPTNSNPVRALENLEYISKDRYRLHSLQGGGSRGEMVEFVKDDSGVVVRLKIGTLFFDRMP